MNDVARAAGVAKAGLYHYFPGKHALLEALHEDLWAEGAERLQSAPRPQDLRQAFSYFGSQYLAYFAEPRRAELMRIALNISVVEPQLLSLSSGAIMPRMQEALVAYFAPCFPKGTPAQAVLLHVIPFIGSLFYYQFIMRATCPEAQLPATPEQYLGHLVGIHALASTPDKKAPRRDPSSKAASRRTVTAPPRRTRGH
jgi:AcrR family transcriptional regulator